MKKFTKIRAGAMATATVMFGAAPANAVVVFDDIDAFLLSLAGSEFFGATLLGEPGAFNHEFEFSILGDSSANSSVTTTLLSGNDVDFASIFLDGFAFTQVGFDPGAENWELSAVNLTSGTHSIFVNGSVVGTSNNGSYSGLLNVATVPEPATWAMMLLGFGAVGATMRFRRRRTSPLLVQI